MRLAPKGAALGAYFAPPSEDFTRPGTTWWSLGEKEQVPIWDEVTTAHHEGFPATTSSAGCRCLGDRLSRVHRLLYWLSGYGEGWALARSGSCASSDTSTARSSCSASCPRTPCGRCGW